MKGLLDRRFTVASEAATHSVFASCKRFVALCVLGLCGCGKLAGIDDFEVRELGDAAASRYAVVSSMFGAGACAQCVARKCDAEIRRCVETEACVDSAACSAACSDPRLESAPQCQNECSRTPSAGASLDVELCVARCEPRDGGGCVAECEEYCSIDLAVQLV